MLFRSLYRSEKRAFLPFLVATPILFALGAALAYFVLFPAAFQFFVSFEDSQGGGGVPIDVIDAFVGCCDPVHGD